MRSHLAIDVENLNDTKRFIANLFGVEPITADFHHARFILNQPSWNLMLERSGKKSALNHLGVEVETPEQVGEWAKRLTELKICHTYLKNTACCHAKQDQVAFSDPEGNQWEVFFLHPSGPQTHTS